MSILEILSYIGTFILLINTIVYIKSFSFKREAFNIFCVYLLIMLIVTLLTTYYQSQKINNLFLSHYYFLSQFILLSLFYRFILKNKKARVLIDVNLVLIVFFLIFQYIMNISLYNIFNLTEVVVTSIPLIIYSIIFFYNNLSNITKFIYINIGVFIYLLCSTLLFASGNLMVKLDPLINKIVWIVNAAFYILFQILIFIEWRKNYYKKIHRSS